MVKKKSTITPELLQSLLHNSHTGPQHDLQIHHRFYQKMVQANAEKRQDHHSKSFRKINITNKRMYPPNDQSPREGKKKKINAGWERGPLRRSVSQWMIQSDESMIRERAGEAWSGLQRDTDRSWTALEITSYSNSNGSNCCRKWLFSRTAHYTTIRTNLLAALLRNKCSYMTEIVMRAFFF